MKTRDYLVLVGLLFTLSCGPSRRASGSREKTTASITREGFFDCFEKGLTLGGQPVWCEASAILYDGKKLLLANDKDMPDKRSSISYWAFSKGFADTSTPATYQMEPLFKKAKKFEDFAFTPDRKLVFLSTAFDRVRPDGKDWDGYNTVFYWSSGDEKNAQVLTAGAPDTTSVSLRAMISKTLASPAFPEGMPYFKIEGLAATNDKLYFGIREEGKKFDDFTYQFKILSVPYLLTDGRVTLNGSFSRFAEIDLKTLFPDLEKGMGLSSIEYDAYNKRFLLLSSFESPAKMGGYLWSATEAELQNNRINLVKDAEGKPLTFQHKPEDLTLISRKRLLIIHDDDRLVSKVGDRARQPSQAAYSVVDFK
jgi:hypothetical protein